MNHCLLALAIALVSAAAAGADEPKKAAPMFPLKISDNQRFLVDQQGQPFLVVADAGWSIIVEPSAEDARHYLDDRKAKGFNSILVNLLEHKFASRAPRTKSGVAPFEKPGDLSAPNQEYFDLAASVVQEANQRGIVVWLCPAYLGYRGGNAGWFQEIKACGRETLRAYGRYLGRQFKKLPNIVWVIGGDFTPPEEDSWTTNELALGIRETDTVHLMTGHGSPGQSARTAFAGRTWLDVNATYSVAANLFEPLLADYRHQPVQPFVLLETAYENEHHAKPEQLRRQAYWAILCGACGQFFGNCPIWHFGGPGIWKPPMNMNWKQALDSQGSQDMARLQKAFAPRAWQTLVPDLEKQFVVDGAGAGTATITAAVSPDGKLAMAYVPSTGTEARKFTVDLSRLCGPATAFWYNPTSGAAAPCSAEPLLNAGRHDFQTPGDNGTKTNDWLLIVESVAPAVAKPAR